LGGADGGTRGGRGGGATRRGRGGRGGRADRGSHTNKGRNGSNRAKNGGDERTGEKRKRQVEPDGGHDMGMRGQAVPMVVTASQSKKPKTDDGES
jgi:lupus La protein